MNRRIIPFLTGVILISCGQPAEESLSTDLVNNPNSASEEINQEEMPAIKFDEESFDFGEISQGEKVEHDFGFTNTGKSDLIISSAVGSCGCTVPSYPQEPIKPGEKADIHVVFDSNGKTGAQHKRVTVVANTNPNKTMVALMGTVIAPDAAKE